MKCASCSSHELGDFSAEIMIHCVGIDSTNYPGVLLFPKLVVCLACGASQFVIPEAELRELMGCSRNNPPAA